MFPACQLVLKSFLFANLTTKHGLIKVSERRIFSYHPTLLFQDIIQL